MQILAAFVAAMLLAGAGVARADPGSNWPFSGPKGDQDASAFWVDISSVADGTEAGAGELANTICSKLEGGYSEGQLIARGAKGDESKIPKVQLVVHAAEWHFCPTYY
jgi:hypothetical protein